MLSTQFTFNDDPNFGTAEFADSLQRKLDCVDFDEKEMCDTLSARLDSLRIEMFRKAREELQEAPLTGGASGSAVPVTVEVISPGSGVSPGPQPSEPSLSPAAGADSAGSRDEAFASPAGSSQHQAKRKKTSAGSGPASEVDEDYMMLDGEVETLREQQSHDESSGKEDETEEVFSTPVLRADQVLQLLEASAEPSQEQQQAFMIKKRIMAVFPEMITDIAEANLSDLQVVESVAQRGIRFASGESDSGSICDPNEEPIEPRWHRRQPYAYRYGDRQRTGVGAHRKFRRLVQARIREWRRYDTYERPEGEIQAEGQTECYDIEASRQQGG